MTRPIVIKLGGSLLGLPDLPVRLQVVLHSFREAPSILVVGGGKAVEVVRELDSALAIGENQSHALALKALDLTAEVVASVIPMVRVISHPADVPRVWQEQRTPILAPRWFMENIDRLALNPLPETWETTTDSIAARVAVHFDAAGLVLLKSAGPEMDIDLETASRMGLVDSIFPEAARILPWVRLINLRITPIRSFRLT